MVERKKWGEGLSTSVECLRGLVKWGRMGDTDGEVGKCG